MNIVIAYLTARHGGAIRIQKAVAISEWKATYTTLRVCFNKTGYRQDTNSVVNCGRCEKCIRTIKILEVLGRLDRYATFSRMPNRFLNVWLCDHRSKAPRIYAREIMSLAWKTIAGID